jgi:hypothetical protein
MTRGERNWAEETTKRPLRRYGVYGIITLKGDVKEIAVAC